MPFTFSWLNLLIVLVISSSLALTVHAEVIIDSTLGKHGKLAGPEFAITPDLGQQIGSNLFYSFSQFNLNREETATFSGTGNISNIISRITGGNVSTIDGILRSTIPQANLYLINPNGFIFGPHAKLDIDGSFYLTTASEVKLGETGKFVANHPEQSILVSAPPSAFGFLEPTPAKIQIQGSTLTTAEGKTLSLSSNEIQIDGGRLIAVAGHIDLLGIITADKVSNTPSGWIVAPNAQLGSVILENNSSIDVGKQGAGRIIIRSGTFTLESSDFVANTTGEKEGGTITIDVNELQLLNNAKIDSRTFGPGQGGRITIKVTGLATLTDSSILSTASSIEPHSGNAGNLALSAGCLNLSNSTISTTTFGTGRGGDIDIRVGTTLTLAKASAIQASSEAQTGAAGNAGRITIKADNLYLTGANSKIDNSTLGSGQGNSIALDITHTTHLENGASIIADSKGTGSAGNITLNTTHLELDRAAISTTADEAAGGNITINAHHSLKLFAGEISANVKGGKGNSGNVLISNPRIFSLEDSKIIASASSGRGGLILLITGTPIRQRGSLIDASSATGINGEVKIEFPNVGITTLPISFLDAGSLIKKRCAARTETQVSTLIIVGRGGLPNAPNDLQPYLPFH